MAAGVPNHGSEMADQAFVYLLRCVDASLYCGWTTDLDARLEAHRSGRGAAYTRRRPPVGYAAAWRCATRTDARRLEGRLKQLSRAAKLAIVGDAVGLPTGLRELAAERVV